MPELVTPQEAAKILKFRVRIIYDMIHNEEFPNVSKVRDGYRIPLSDIERYLQRTRMFRPKDETPPLSKTRRIRSSFLD